MASEAINPDILIVGGGIQGVMLLHELSAAGVQRVLLATAGDLGEGETLHSHGYLHHGYMLPATEAPLVRALHDCAAWWQERIGSPYRSAPTTYYGVAEPAAAGRIGTWDEFGARYKPAERLPAALEGGDASARGLRLFSIADRLVSMRDILTGLSAPLQNHIVSARLIAIELDEGGGRVARCVLSMSSGEVPVKPKILLLACGRAAQPLLRSMRTPSGQRPLETVCAGFNRIRFLPMLLVRGSNLPELTAFFESHGLWILTHPVRGEESMWIVSLLEGHETYQGDFERGREQLPGGPVVTETVGRLCTLVPAARDRLDKDLRFSFYFGGKTDHPEGGNRRYVNNFGIANLRLAWPGLWSLSLANAREIVAELRTMDEFASLFDPGRPPLDLPATGVTVGVSVGEELRLTSTQVWHPWTEFRKLQGAG